MISLAILLAVAQPDIASSCAVNAGKTVDAEKCCVAIQKWKYEAQRIQLDLDILKAKTATVSAPKAVLTPEPVSAFRPSYLTVGLIGTVAGILLTLLVGG